MLLAAIHLKINMLLTIPVVISVYGFGGMDLMKIIFFFFFVGIIR